MPIARPCCFNNTDYDSLTDAARAVGVSIATMKRWIDAGYTSRADVPKRGMKPRLTYRWNDTLYPDVDTMADALYLTPHGVWWRLRQGHTGDADMRWERAA